MTTLLEGLTPEQLAQLKAGYLPKLEMVAYSQSIYKELNSENPPRISLQTALELRAKGVYYYCFDNKRKSIFIGIDVEAYTAIWANDPTDFPADELLQKLTGKRGVMFTNDELNGFINSHLSKETKEENKPPRMLTFSDPLNPFREDLTMVLIEIDCSNVVRLTL